MTKITNLKSDEFKQLVYSLFYGLTFFFLYLTLGYLAGRLAVGITSGLINGSLIFLLNSNIPTSKFWDPLETKREKLNNYVWWISVCIFSYLIYGTFTFIAI